jgi:hypothetical protein
MLPILQGKENNRVRAAKQKGYFVKRLQLSLTGITSLLQVSTTILPLKKIWGII